MMNKDQFFLIWEHLTPKEKEMVVLLSCFYSDGEIAKLTQRSLSAVSKMKREVYRKFSLTAEQPYLKREIVIETYRKYKGEL